MRTVNGVPVIGVSAVAWKPDDDEAVRALCEARGLVLFDGGGKSDAIVIGGRAIIWERQGERFRAFDVPERDGSHPFAWVVNRLLLELRSQHLDNTPQNVGTFADVQRDAGYRAGWNDRTRHLAKLLERFRG